MLHGGEGEGVEAVDIGDERAVELQGRDKSEGVGDQVGVEAALEGLYAVLGAGDFLFQFLELRGDVAFGVDKSLLAHPALGHMVLVGVSDLEIIAEDVVESYLERRDTGGLAFALLKLEEDIA